MCVCFSLLCHLLYSSSFKSLCHTTHCDHSVTNAVSPKLFNGILSISGLKKNYRKLGGCCLPKSPFLILVLCGSLTAPPLASQLNWPRQISPHSKARKDSSIWPTMYLICIFPWQYSTPTYSGYSEVNVTAFCHELCRLIHSPTTPPTSVCHSQTDWGKKSVKDSFIIL